MAEEIPWVSALLELLVQALTPHAFFGPLGYRLWEPEADCDEPVWTLAVFPVPHECRGGSADGQFAVSGFTLDQLLIQSAFSKINSVVWHMPSRYNNDLDGPELRVLGTFCGRGVQLRFFHLPPPDEVASHVYEMATGRSWLRQGDG